MKKIKVKTAGNIALVFTVLLGVFAVAQFIAAMVAADRIAEMLRNISVNYYSGVSDFPRVLWNEACTAVYEPKYVRMMSMFIFTLCIPCVYALFNIYLICKNGEGNQPFGPYAKSGFLSVGYAFAAELFLDLVVFSVLKIVLKKIPFYMWYVVAAVAVLSVILVVLSAVFVSLINRANEIRQEHKKIRTDKKEIDSVVVKRKAVHQDYESLYKDILPPEK